MREFRGGHFPQSYSPRHFFLFSIFLFCLLAKVFHLFTTNQGRVWADP